MLYDVSQPPYLAWGDGITDDTDAIQRALDDAAQGLDLKGLPRAGHAAVLPVNDRPNGGRVYLPSGNGARERAYRTYRVTRPLRIWGMTEVFGDGPMTMLDGRAIPRDRALFEHHHLEIGRGEWMNGGTSYHDFALMSGGHAFANRPGLGGRVSGLGTRWERLQICCCGYGIWFPHPAYSQGLWIDQVSQFNPCSGGVCIAGNLNFVRRYALVRGYGGWDRKQEFRSPWLDGRGQIDVGGQGNDVYGCHVEHGLPTTDGAAAMRDAVVPFRFWCTDPGPQQHWVHVESCWPEFQMRGAVADGCHYIFDRLIPTGTWATAGIRTRYVDAGLVRIPYYSDTLLTQVADVRGTTRLGYGYVRGEYAVDLPPNTAVERAFMRGGYASLGGKEYDPNPRGPDLPYTVTPYAVPGAKVDTTLVDGDIRIEVTATGRTDGRDCGGVVLTPKDQEDRPWVLYAAEHNGACYLAWWPDDPRTIGQDALCRTTHGRTAVPLVRWKPGSKLVLGATAVGVTWFRKVRINPLD